MSYQGYGLRERYRSNLSLRTGKLCLQGEFREDLKATLDGPCVISGVSVPKRRFVPSRRDDLK
jgi:hypothetical protein